MSGVIESGLLMYCLDSGDSDRFFVDADFVVVFGAGTGMFSIIRTFPSTMSLS